MEYAEKHTGSNLCEYIKNMSLEWSIDNKITAIPSDNAYNVTAAIRQGNWRQVACYAHTFLLVKEALSAINCNYYKGESSC